MNHRRCVVSVRELTTGKLVNQWFVNPRTYEQLIMAGIRHCITNKHRQDHTIAIPINSSKTTYLVLSMWYSNRSDINND